jgi:septal ring factor EnvC (AmiA/AmiB activator)
VIVSVALLYSCKCERDNDEAKQMEQSFSQQQNIDQELAKSELGKIYTELKKLDDGLLDQNVELSDEKRMDMQDKLSDIDDNIATIEDKIEDASGKNKEDFQQIAGLFLKKAEITASYGYNSSRMKELAQKLQQKSQ